MVGGKELVGDLGQRFTQLGDQADVFRQVDRKRYAISAVKNQRIPTGPNATLANFAGRQFGYTS